MNTEPYGPEANALSTDLNRRGPDRATEHLLSTSLTWVLKRLPCGSAPSVLCDTGRQAGRHLPGHALETVGLKDTHTPVSGLGRYFWDPRVSQGEERLLMCTVKATLVWEAT